MYTCTCSCTCKSSSSKTENKNHLILIVSKYDSGTKKKWNIKINSKIKWRANHDHWLTVPFRCLEAAVVESYNNNSFGKQCQSFCDSGWSDNTQREAETWKEIIQRGPRWNWHFLFLVLCGTKCFVKVGTCSFLTSLVLIQAKGWSGSRDPSVFIKTGPDMYLANSTRELKNKYSSNFYRNWIFYQEMTVGIL